MVRLRMSDRKEWAQTLFVTEKITQKEIAAKVGVSAVTINKWVKAGDWQKLQQSMIVTRQEQLNRIYLQIQELNNHIFAKEEGKRFADSKEADAMSKLTSAAKTLENDTSVADIIEVSKQLLNWLRATAPTKAEELARIFDDFIKDKLKR